MPEGSVIPASADMRSLRERLGESQAAFGTRFNVDQSTVHRWETEGSPVRGPAVIVFNHLLTELGLCIEDIGASAS